MARFNDCLAFTLGPSIEGGYSNNAADRGGATQAGVTQVTYDNYRRAMGLPLQPVNMITQDEITQIYYKYYWLVAKCDQMPVPVDLCMFDTAVNSGPGRAAILLQDAVGVSQDGAIGPQTLSAVAAMTPIAVATQYCDQREQFFRDIVASNASQAIFLNGWLNRVNALRTACGIPLN